MHMGEALKRSTEYMMTKDTVRNTCDSFSSPFMRTCQTLNVQHIAITTTKRSELNN